ncbi:LuxR C-terminal-related transcriptional regulator [Sphingomonas sp. CARO-RG-8B-R24-01]|uniref:response regulator transcription factor n=1 Tax=Sphingomonas sp. CARO-RG-8B-R24-01 TaxID=2914831 RepID=UPI001F576F5F|nr:LuxR C-terminal-related transcriptional regulator [Sphingomonas sp. CARO-RG-8B-R24-01]
MFVYVIAQDTKARQDLHKRLAPAGLTVWPFAFSADFLAQLENLRPAPILIDLEMPQTGGLALLAALADDNIHWPVIVMIASADTPRTVEAMHRGALTVLELPLRSDLLSAALDHAIAQLGSAAGKTRKRQLARAHMALLTARERSVVASLIDGMTNKAIATALAISPRTVEGHRAHALQKLNVRSIAEIVHLAADCGLDPHGRPSAAR